MSEVLKKSSWPLAVCSLGLSFATGAISFGSETNDRIGEQLAALEKQNILLMQMIDSQQAEINRLRARVETVARSAARQSEELEDLEENRFDTPAPPRSSALGSAIHLSGEAGVAFFAGEANTLFPNEEFRVDEARLFVDARVTDGIYLFTELDLFTRETYDPGLELGELYIEIENLIPWRAWDRAVNLRAGRLYIPFGEEYQERDVMDNPLISHSISDFWGLDEGVELYGELSGASYVLAIQNGSHDFLQDYTRDKSLTVRIGFDPAAKVHLSGSVMRTGSIDTEKEGYTELWFGNSLFRSVGSEDTSRFAVDLAQVDARLSWNNGNLGLAFGKAWYDDNDPNGYNARDLRFWHLEARQGLSEKLFAAVRYSGFDVDEGYPVSGMAGRGQYFFNPDAPLATELRRLSLGITYWPKSDLILKLEYTLEDADQVNGSERTDLNQLSAEAGVRF